MPVSQLRPAAPDPSEPQLHDLPAIRFEGHLVTVKLAVRRTDDAMWRARLHFIEDAENRERVTAEIFCATSEQDLWQAVRDLRDHHLRDLFRSLTT